MTLQSVIFPVLAAFFLSAVLGKLIIPLLKRIKAGQMVREDGPATHLKKTGTPTMGGVLILASVVITSCLYGNKSSLIFPVLLMTVGFGLVGFLDDFIKIMLHRSLGLTPLQKTCLQILVATVFLIYLRKMGMGDLMMRLPFMKNTFLSLGVWDVPIYYFIVLGTVNGVNLTDGLDGLAGSVTIMISTFLTVIAAFFYPQMIPVCGALTGALLGFLLFNVHPASVFMGDTGSLALGGFVAACAYLMQLPLFLPMIGAVYVVEALSVMIQVAFFRVSGGRRLFKMAPLHHHFELCGLEETKIVAVFAIFTAILCLVALLGLYK